MNKARRAFRSVALVIMLSFFFGCGDTVTTNNNSGGATISTVSIIGRVSEAATLQAIQGADLELLDTFGTVSIGTAETAADGSFTFFNIETGSYKIRVTASDYADTEFSVNISSTSSPVKNIGYVLLGKAFDLTVVVTDKGMPVAGVPVLAFSYSDTSQCITSIYETIANASSRQIISSETNTAGIAVLRVNQCARYEIVTTSFDSDNDGLNDYVSDSFYYGFVPAYNNTTVALSLRSMPSYDSTDPQQVISANSRRSNDIFYNASNITYAGGFFYSVSSLSDAIGSKQPIRIVFQYPVVLSGVITASYSDDLVNPDGDGNAIVDTGFPFEKQVAVTASLDSSGTILTLMPPAAGFPVNRVMTIQGSLTTITNGVSDITELSDITNMPGGVYIADDGDSGLNSGSAITVDNYNGDNGASGTVYVEFPEYVDGTVRVISYTKAGISTTVNGSALSSGGIIFTDGGTAGACPGKCGQGAGIFYRLNTGVSLSDGDLMTLAVDVADMEGNRLSRQVQLMVQ